MLQSPYYGKVPIVVEYIVLRYIVVSGILLQYVGGGGDERIVEEM